MKIWSRVSRVRADREPHVAVAVGVRLALCVLGAEEISQAEVHERLERRVAAMGTELRLELWAPARALAIEASEAAVLAVELVEARWSTWREESEVSRFNRAPRHRPFSLSEELSRELSRALFWRDETGGAFNPVMAALVDVWGLEVGGRWPDEQAVGLARVASSREAILFELPAQATRRIAGSGLASGGFAKGVALDAAASALLAAGATRAILDFGGQVLLVGTAWTGQPARIALADPRERDLGVLGLDLPGGSAATSGNGERGLLVDGTRIGHLLDPRSGRPAADFGSLTVWTGTATDADCLSTGLYVLGPDAALEFAEERPGIEVVVLETSGERLRVRASAGLRESVTVLDPRVVLE